MESLSNIKYEDIEIKSEKNYDDSPFHIKDEPVDCTSEHISCSILMNCVNVKEEIANICNNNTKSSPWSIKHEDIEIKSQDNYSDISQHLKNELTDCSTEFQSKCIETTNHSTFERKRQCHGSNDNCSDLIDGNPSEHKIYKCDSCDYKSNRKGNLARHQLRHKNILEEIHKCDSCNYETVYKAHFKKHQLKHKDIPEEQMFKCDSCDYKTTLKNSLRQHRLKHKDVSEKQMFKCDQCDYKTTYKRCLTQHELKHKKNPEEQMFRCDLCIYKTYDMNNLTRHQLKHKYILEDQMFKCDSCDYKTMYKSYFTKHQLKH